jgi:hypothetical protein
MSRFHQPLGQRRRQLSINDKSHSPSLATGHEHRMIHFPGRVFQASPNVFGLEIRKIAEDFRFTNASGQQVEHILDPDAQAPNARPSATLIRIKSDPLCVLHTTQCIGFRAFIQADII